jgi:hypothetical protein
MRSKKSVLQRGFAPLQSSMPAETATTVQGITACVFFAESPAHEQNRKRDYSGWLVKEG